MGLPIWEAAATMVATHIRHNKYHFRRGMLLVPHDQEGVIIIWVFGNDHYASSAEARHEVELVRQRLRDTPVEELGFGLSRDGYTWALVLRAGDGGLQTPVGRAFHMEMLKADLDEAVRGAWQEALRTPAEANVGAVEKWQPAG